MARPPATGALAADDVPVGLAVGLGVVPADELGAAEDVAGAELVAAAELADDDGAVLLTVPVGAVDVGAGVLDRVPVDSLPPNNDAPVPWLLVTVADTGWPEASSKPVIAAMVTANSPPAARARCLTPHPVRRCRVRGLARPGAGSGNRAGSASKRLPTASSTVLSTRRRVRRMEWA